MPADPLNNLIPHLRQALLRGNEAGLTDGQLLECFVNRREQAALEALVRRHSSMVWGVCRRVLASHHDAEDAFQATFLVLVRKAASILPREMVANWLYGVARQTAMKSRATTAKRRTKEKQVADLPETVLTEQDLCHDLLPLLDRELSRLPDKYRVAIVLCDLEGKTRKEAARQLGLPEGTVASRLMRARTTLAKRLARHGPPVSGGALALVLSQEAASACVPIFVVSSTIKAATLLAAGQEAAGLTSAHVAALMEGVLKAMLFNKLKTATLVLVMMLLCIGSGLLIVTAVADEKKPQSADETKPQLPAVNPLEKGLVQTTATVLSLAYVSNDAEADEKFTDRHLEVAGKFSEVHRVELDQPFTHRKVYVLSMAMSVGGPTPVWFQFALKDQKQLAALKHDWDMTIRGECKGRITIVADGKPQQAILVSDCKIVSAKPPTDKSGGTKGSEEQKP